MNEQELDQLLNDMRQEEPDPATVAAARERVWNQLSAGPACQRFRSQFADYQAGTLAEAQRMLLEDHLARCAGCRRSMHSEPVVTMAPVARRRFTVPRWAIAAGVAAVSLFLGRNYLDHALAPSGPRATVEGTSGTLYSLNASPLAKGATIADGDIVRTAAGATAQLRLADGSLVEVNERTELSLKAAWSGATIQLERGDIIVRAAKQRRGYLKVVSRDSEAAVKGTIFTVSAGTAGSLVGVVEGSVAVTQPGTERLLKPGEQSTTSPALAKVTVREAVSWSKDVELLTELAAIEKQLPPPAARTSAKIVSMLPPDVVVYGAIPNLGPTMTQAVSLIEQRSRDNAALREWWATASAGETRQLLDKVRVLSPMLGDEIVFILQRPRATLVMVEVKPGQQSALEAELKKLLPTPAAYRVVNGVLLIGRNATELNALIAQLGQGTQTPFAQEVAKRYSRGVSWILGADVEAIGIGKAPEALGANQLKFAFIEQHTVQGVEENEATVTFNGPRTGIASWLAAPGSAGSTEYASADAVAVFSAATRNPRQIFDELSTLVPGFAEQLRQVETRTGVNLTNDLASALGTDFTLSLETAAVPIPGWFAAVEVYQPATLNATMNKIVDAYNREAPAERKLAFKQENIDGRLWYSVTFSGLGLQWTFDRGYWIVSMDRAVALRAIATRSNGFPLVRSSQFRAQLPSSAGLHRSGFAWFNLGPASSMLSSLTSSPQLQKLLAVRDASLITFNGETERIQVASRTRFTSLMLDTMLQAHMTGKRAK
jgi:hypothetical protein